MRAKVVINSLLCKGCSLCIDACPKKILAISKKTNNKGYYIAEQVEVDKCNGCMLCALMCPDVAIEVYKEKQGVSQ